MEQVQAQTGQEVTIRWLDGTPPPIASGVSWGVPWARGAVRREQAFSLAAADGTRLPLETWPLAFWPDGSLKWSGFATVANAPGPLRLVPGSSANPASILVTENENALVVNTGPMRCVIPRKGAALIESMTLENRVVAGPARLTCTVEDRSQLESNRTLRFDDFISEIKQVAVERPGPIRAVVKIEGVHKSNNREWLPFQVRLYFYAGSQSVRLIHTIVFDGDDRKDFIRGLGIVFAVPMREQVHNRHVRFSGEGNGLWSEPVEPATGRRALPGGAGVYADQLAGKRIPGKESFDARGQKLLTDWASWDGYKLVQPTPDGFTIQKRANAQSCWLDAAAGRRASGLAFAGDVTGGLAVGVRNFWQSYPASLEVAKATSNQAELTVWLWSPDAPAMDLRHYDTRAHDLDSSYEDVQPGFSTPNGVGRTSEMTLFPSASVPSKEVTAWQAQLSAQPPLLVAGAEHLHAAGAFGIWSLPDRSTPTKKSLEEQIDGAFSIYQKEVEQRRWYGFWNFGDVMHQHDGPRHMWRYDVGGFAWDNSELGTDMWLWYSFLRSGRADIFRMAEAMTRHTGEVDTYHSGRFAGLGSRHNVRHWGCGAKEARISQAAYRRFHYYLTTDERSGDLMHAAADADFKATEIDPMREAVPLAKPIPYPGRVRGGPDWLAFIGNWMTEWERTGNTKYRDKIITGMDAIANMPYGFLSGPNNLFGYDPKTGELHTLYDDPYGTYNLTTIMGGAEVVFELNELIDHAGWKRAWLQYCRLYTAPKEVIKRDMASGTEGADAAFARPDRLAAYVYLQTKNPAFAKKAIDAILTRRPAYATRRVEGPEVLSPIDEISGLSTNSVAQSTLIAIQVLEMCKDQIPG